jgi:hypothetical protein
MASFELQIGDVVSLKSHPYNFGMSSIVISGEPTLLPPLMVITEIVLDFKDQFDEKTGEQLAKRGNSQCKCIWYSHKSCQFEEAWMHSSLIKLISRLPKTQEKKDLVDETVVNAYKSVCLKTVDLELCKHKSSLSCEESFQTNNDRIILTPLLSFVSPVMEVIQVQESKDGEQKQVKYDNKTGQQKRFTSKWQVKCKWFNPGSNKMSEKVFPIEAIQVVEKVDESTLFKIQESIDAGLCLKVGGTEEQTIVRPKYIVCRNGHYFLRAYDYNHNKIVELKIGISKLFQTKTPFLFEAPTFNFLLHGVQTLSVMDEYMQLIEEAKQKNNFIRIKYKNRNDKISLRTLKNYKVHKAKNEDDEDIFYLTGYCSHRKDERTFRSDRIQKLQILDLQFDIGEVIKAAPLQ